MFKKACSRKIVLTEISLFSGKQLIDRHQSNEAKGITETSVMWYARTISKQLSCDDVWRAREGRKNVRQTAGPSAV